MFLGSRPSFVLVTYSILRKISPPPLPPPSSTSRPPLLTAGDELQNVLAVGSDDKPLDMHS